MVTAGVDHRKQARIDGRGFAAAGLKEGGIPLGQFGRAGDPDRRGRLRIALLYPRWILDRARADNGMAENANTIVNPLETGGKISNLSQEVNNNKFLVNGRGWVKTRPSIPICVPTLPPSPYNSWARVGRPPWGQQCRFLGASQKAGFPREPKFANKLLSNTAAAKELRKSAGAISGIASGRNAISH